MIVERPDWLEEGFFYLYPVLEPELVRWECCGNLWELIVGPAFPERLRFAPECPGCGKTLCNAHEMVAQNRLQAWKAKRGHKDDEDE